MRMDYEVIVIGAGPAGIFTALTLSRCGVGPVLILEQGKELAQRDRARSRDMLCGWGGAGAYSDGKLTISPEVGGFLNEFMDWRSLQQILEAADRVYVEHGAPDRIFGDASPRTEELADRARLADLLLIPMRIRHIGTENCRVVLDRLRRSLEGRVDVRHGCRVNSILAEGGKARGVRLTDGDTVSGRFVVAAPGRSGAGWMKKEAAALGLKTMASPVDLGVRVELPAPVLREITDTAYEAKLVHYSTTFDDKVRTFCMNPFGEVVIETVDDIVTVNGHSFAERRTENTNFAILVSSAFTEPFDDPIGYGLYIARLANLLGKGAIVQRLGDLLAGRRSTRERILRCLTRPTLQDATPGDLSFVLPYRHLVSIIEMLQTLDKLAPGVASRHTLLYGVEVKFYSNRIHVSREMETEVANLFAIGDGAGITRGLLQASASGILAARAIAARLGKPTVEH
ncbi:FAD-dependent oxidoreductase [Desulfoglaeba alkanexedens ALDC]|uniref:FAD-dependent oxidoreductase n=2 Tax=Desulfoglaeba alkanexedens TaxID=361111 RepID=A0A4V1ERR9_9BACT|nr:FAD-dependent oxidoreductase [Desulfoglaeba alkanexedens ALDC]